MDSRVLRVNNLIKRIQQNDKKALDILFVEYGALFLGMAKKYLFDKDYAQDLLSEVFLELLKSKARSFDANFNGLNWIFTIIRNKAFKHNGQAHHTFSLEEQGGAKALQDVINLAGDSDKALDKIILKDALQALSAYENQLLYCKYWEGLTIREIAKRVQKPRSTIHYDIKKALKNLKKLLSEIEYR